MDLACEHFRAMIFYDFRRESTRQQCIDQLNSTFGDKAPHYSTVKRQFNEFERGRRSLTDESREGRPKLAVLPKSIDAVCELIKQDRHVTYRKVEASLSISFISVHSILHEHSVKKICFRWIPHKMTIAHKKERVDWCKKTMK